MAAERWQIQPFRPGVQIRKRYIHPPCVLKIYIYCAQADSQKDDEAEMTVEAVEACFRSSSRRLGTHCLYMHPYVPSTCG